MSRKTITSFNEDALSDSDLTYQNIEGFDGSVREMIKLIPKRLDDINSIVQQAVPHGTRIKAVKNIGHGANNQITIWQAGRDFIVSRIARNPTFQLVSPDSNEIKVIGKNNESKKNILYQAIQSKKNWEDASRKNLCPHIYDYGYIEEDGFFFNYIVSEKMDSDLEEYYNSGPGKANKDTGSLQPTDHEIAKQLVDLLYATTNELGLICFDIKPANCMINYSDGNIVVKLIDWDGDWCQDYSYVTSNRILRNQISILSVMIMAAHFYVFLDWNIFYNYFQNPDIYGNYVNDNKKSLKDLFCGDLKNADGEESEFDFFQKHYFKILDIDDRNVTCTRAFDITFNRVHYLNQKAKHAAKGGKGKKTRRKKSKRSYVKKINKAKKKSKTKKYFKKKHKKIKRLK